ncbi:uncharacterized protein LOC125704139 [Brienomyrus brachyistius]|uniref:uncharacterized protein LOC125704139 n=1 Tax=Brienomyrus brachyistius TaxID=42636 RepID=UPI0020B34F68|nr:uncharacterized protein LOC125704139 [Brienomyrus brachyistius]
MTRQLIARLNRGFENFAPASGRAALESLTGDLQKLLQLWRASDPAPELPPLPADPAPEQPPLPADPMPEQPPLPADPMPEQPPLPADHAPESPPLPEDPVPEQSPSLPPVPLQPAQPEQPSSLSAKSAQLPLPAAFEHVLPPVPVSKFRSPRD